MSETRFNPPDPVPVLSLDYERGYDQSVALGWLRRGLGLLAISLLMGSAHWLLFTVVSMGLSGYSIQAFLIASTAYSDLILLVMLLGAWIVLGFDWSGRRVNTVPGGLLRAALAAAVAMQVVNSFPTLLGLRSNAFGSPGRMLLASTTAILWVSEAALFLHVCLLLKGFEQRLRVALAILVPLMLALRLHGVFLTVSSFSNPQSYITFIQAHPQIWRAEVLTESGLELATAVLLIVAASSLRRRVQPG